MVRVRESDLLCGCIIGILGYKQISEIKNISTTNQRYEDVKTSIRFAPDFGRMKKLEAEHTLNWAKLCIESYILNIDHGLLVNHNCSTIRSMRLSIGTMRANYKKMITTKRPTSTGSAASSLNTQELTQSSSNRSETATHSSTNYLYSPQRNQDSPSSAITATTSSTPSQSQDMEEVQEKQLSINKEISTDVAININREEGNQNEDFQAQEAANEEVLANAQEEEAANEDSTANNQVQEAFNEEVAVNTQEQETANKDSAANPQAQVTNNENIGKSNQDSSSKGKPTGSKPSKSTGSSKTPRRNSRSAVYKEKPENITGHTWSHGIPIFKVKWAGYDIVTGERFENIQDAKDLVRNYINWIKSSKSRNAVIGSCKEISEMFKQT